jgi:hypothetical protein
MSALVWIGLVVCVLVHVAAALWAISAACMARGPRCVVMRDHRKIKLAA